VAHTEPGGEPHRRGEVKAGVRHLVAVVWILVACMPVTFLGTFALYPLWSWIESRYGIESVGHSGPADWCFWTVYALLVAIVVAWYGRAIRRRRA
jgi:hypothetical protein